MRLKSKQATAMYMKALRRTGNIEPECYPTKIENRISKIFGKYGTGLSIIKEAGIPPRKGMSQESSDPQDFEDEKYVYISLIHGIWVYAPRSTTYTQP